MSWIYLFIASLLEMGWPIGLKFAQNSEMRILWILFALIFMCLSGYFLFLAQKNISIGVAYAIWTSIGMVGTFLFSVLFFHDALSVFKCLGIFLILCGVIMLKLCN